MTKIYSHFSDDIIPFPAARQKRNRTMSECAGMHYANLNFTGSNNNPIVGKSEMEKTYYTGIYVVMFQIPRCNGEQLASCNGYL